MLILREMFHLQRNPWYLIQPSCFRKLLCLLLSAKSVSMCLFCVNTAAQLPLHEAWKQPHSAHIKIILRLFGEVLGLWGLKAFLTGSWAITDNRFCCGWLIWQKSMNSFGLDDWINLINIVFVVLQKGQQYTFSVYRTILHLVGKQH